MPLTINLFGQLGDLAGTSVLELEAVSDTEMLREKIDQRFPAFSAIPYRIAIDKQIITGKVTFSEGASIALLPPFSGG